jgi:hypothetical protein
MHYKHKKENFRFAWTVYTGGLHLKSEHIVSIEEFSFYMIIGTTLLFLLQFKEIDIWQIQSYQ